MSTPNRLNRELIRGEVISKIHWGREVPEVLALLQTQYGIQGDEADGLITEALASRQREVRKRALVRLVFACVGLAISGTYYAIKSFTHTISFSSGSVLLGSLGIMSLLAVVRSTGQLVSGESSRPV